MRARSSVRSPSLRAVPPIRLAFALLAVIAIVLFTALVVRPARARSTEPAVERAAIITAELSSLVSTPPVPLAPAWTTLAGETVDEVGVAPVRIVAPRARATKGAAPPVYTMLHGAGSNPAGNCARMHGVTDLGALLLCPTGNVVYDASAADWQGEGTDKARHLDQSVGATMRRLDLEEAPIARGDVLMGYSRGAFVARDVAYERPGKWVGLVLIGAAFVPDVDKLKASGIRRVVLASGDHDGAKKTMIAARNKLCAAGIPARFESLGPVWHALPADTVPRLGDALAWVRSNDVNDATCVKR